MTQPERIAKGMYWDQAWSLVEGCTPISPGCDHCWAASQAHVRAGQKNPKIRARYEGLTTDKGKWNGQIRLLTNNLGAPLRRRKPIVYAVWNDLFHEDAPDEFIDRAFAVMALSPEHTFLVLTKRPDRMREYIQRLTGDVGSFGLPEPIDEVIFWPGLLCHSIRMRDGWKQIPADYDGPDLVTPEEWVWTGEGKPFSWPLPNVFCGVTAENQETANKRIPILLQIPAAVRFISVEPMLGPVDLSEGMCERGWWCDYCQATKSPQQVTYDELCTYCGGSVEWKEQIDWVICGGETGPGARPMHPDWARSLRDQCKAAGVSFFFKHWGEWYPDRKGIYEGDSAIFGNTVVHRIGKKAAGRLLDGVECNEMPGVSR